MLDKIIIVHVTTTNIASQQEGSGWNYPKAWDFSEWSLHVLHSSVPLGASAFFPKSKDMQVRLIAGS